MSDAAPTSAPATPAAPATTSAPSAPSNGAPAPAPGAPATPPTPEQSAAALRAQWQADNVRRDRAERELKQVLRERDEALKAAQERAKLADNPLDLILKSDKKNEYARELIKHLGQNAQPEPTPEQKLAREVEALKAERQAERTASEQRAAEAQVQAQHEAARAALADHAEKFPLAAGVATPEQLIRTLHEMHAANRRPTEAELIEEVERQITAGLSSELDKLLAIPAFRALVDARLGEKQTANTADPQAIPGGANKPKTGIRNLTNKLSGSDADEVDWTNVPKHELRKHALREIEKSRVG